MSASGFRDDLWGRINDLSEAQRRANSRISDLEDDLRDALNRIRVLEDQTPQAMWSEHLDGSR